MEGKHQVVIQLIFSFLPCKRDDNGNILVPTKKKKGKVLNNNAWASFKILTLFYFLLENFGKKTLFFEEEFHHFQKKKNSFEQEKFVMRNNISFSLKRKDL